MTTDTPPAATAVRVAGGGRPGLLRLDDAAQATCQVARAGIDLPTPTDRLVQRVLQRRESGAAASPLPGGVR